MADLLRELQAQMSGKTIDKIANQIGGNQQQTSAAVSAALPMILQALSKNATNEQGANSLFNAIAKDHDGSALNNLTGLINNFQSGPGAGILRHVLGQKQNKAESIVSQTSGLNAQATNQLLQILAPIVMAQLGKQKQKGGLDVGGLANLLIQNTARQQKQQPKAAGFLNQFLDQDGDGNIQDDLTNMGVKALSGFFRKK
ncbi:MAG: DUF937 domain-containing protein [Bacteroidetes bacterium]|nr:DUF937 domain-containing protein [Bacteroidota bacterium]